MIGGLLAFWTCGLVWHCLLGRAGLFGPLAIWNPGHSVCFLAVVVLILWWFAVPSGMWDTGRYHDAGQEVCASYKPHSHAWILLAFLGQMRSAQVRRHGGEGCWIWTCTTRPQKRTSRPVTWISVGGLLRCLVLVLGLTVRVGEALHPGPSESVMDHWTLGIANPSGLNGKLDQVAHLEGDTWMMTETQLSRHGVANLQKGLKMLKSPWKYAVPGFPCAPRRHTDTGSHSGVMVLSKLPVRALPHDFSVDSYATSRLQVVGLAVADVWVTLGVLYGVPCNAQHKQARYQTDALLADLVDRVACQSAGPRAIGGDFNYGPDELDQLHRLQSLGFREVQDLRAWRHGISTEATGRGSRRLDQLWISPELQRVYVDTRVSFDHWADHAAVSASFSHDQMTQLVHAWPTPQPFPWPSDWTCQLNVDFAGDLTHAYAAFWSQVESQATCWAKQQGLQVLKKQRGRACTLAPQSTRVYLCPVKKARQGDLQPTYMGVSLQHARYFRQLRRLQSLDRILSKGVTTCNGQLNRDETWRSIRTAVGFPGGFGVWWNSQGLAPALDSLLPLLCPGLDFVRALFLGFQGFVQKYEASLVKQRYQHAKQRRATKLAHVFQDCRDEPLPQADTLLDRVSVGVEDVRPEDNSVVLQRPVTLLDGLPVILDGQAVSVVAHAEDQVWLEHLPDLQPGCVLTQERAVMSDTDILARFAAVWERRWVKQSHVVPGQWDQICGFLERTARPLEWCHDPWTLHRLDRAIRAKKPRAAKGPDGVAQPDLAALPLAARHTLLRFYDAVESGTPWPTQLAAGFVSCLAKHTGAQQVDEFRPVVVYSLPYRVWSSVRAREALRSVLPVLPTSIQGGVPARQAKSIWFELAYALERSYIDGVGLHGLLMDIQKCFNNIPRFPLWCALVHLGFPTGTLQAWASFVAGQTRRVRTSVGDALSSNCGLPEGCALSVFGMAMVDWMLDWWLQGLEVSVDLRTFVDDWGVLFRDAGALDRVWTSLEQFTAHMDLSIDMGKTRLWSTEADARREFRSGELRVTLAARNLGAHQNFSRHCHNAEVQKRLTRMPQIWIRLRASQATYKQKVTAIHMMAWPRALHGIAVVHLGASHLKCLRSGAVRALRADRKGSNPYLHLVTSSLLTDPEAWMVVQTLRDVRELGHDQPVEATLGLFASAPGTFPLNGPSAILLSRLHRLGWGVGSQGLVQDRFGTFSLMTIAWDELLIRVRYGWGHVLAQELQHRPTFDGLANVDLTELHLALKEFGPVDQVYLRCHLDGTLFTQNARARFCPEVSSNCPWCSEKDGFHHRAWICPHFAPCRTHLTPAQMECLPRLPSCLVDHGWPVVVPEWEVFSRWLLQGDGFCRMSPIEPSVRNSPQVLELFVDGTCAYPTDVKLRFAAWAITVVPGGVGSMDNQVLACGYVQGLNQSPFRAELMAVLRAVQWAVQHQQAVRIWSDCQGVVRRFRKLLQGGAVKSNGPNSDLWGHLQTLVQQHGDLLQVRQVVSHGSLQQATCYLEDWVYWHNGLTDLAAEGVNFRRPEAFWKDWLGLYGALDFHRQLHRAILLVLLKTSRLAAASEVKPAAPEAVPGPVQPVLPVPTVWRIPDKLIKRYGITNLQHVHNWWQKWGVRMLQGTGPLRYIAGIQLFISFHLHTGYQGPWCHKKRWFSTATEVPIVARKQWGDRCKLFLMLLQSYWKGNGLTIPNKLTRPHASSVSRWLVCYRLKWSDEMTSFVDRHVFAQLGRQAASSQDLASLRAALDG